MMDVASQAAAWLPALIFPTATWSQLRVALRAADRSAISVTTWTLFGLANCGALVLADPSGTTAWLQAGIGFGLTAVLDFAIVLVATSGIGARGR
jgi:hypothetical protein